MGHVDLILKAVNASLDPKKVILFGSSAFGKDRKDSDLDIAVIQKSSPKLGQKAKVFLALAKLGYDWSREPDIHLFSEKEFSEKLKRDDLFVAEVAKGKMVYLS
jgi:predicted nucleotidyltransferase